MRHQDDLIVFEGIIANHQIVIYQHPLKNNFVLDDLYDVDHKFIIEQFLVDKLRKHLHNVFITLLYLHFYILQIREVYIAVYQS